MKIVIAAAAALAMAAAPFAANAAMVLDLRGINLTTEAGQVKAKIVLQAAAEEYCGRTDIPQPLELRLHAEACQSRYKERAERIVAARTKRAVQLATR